MKKRTLFILIGLFLLMFPLIVSAEIIDSGTCGDNLTWTLNTDRVLTVSGTGMMSDYDYANSVTTAPWANYISNINIITFSDGVTSIGNYAFYNCSAENIMIPDSITSIGEYAFTSSDLKSVVLPDNLTHIGSNAFRECYNLSSIIVPGRVTTIGDYAFSGCSNLTDVSILEGTINIGNGVFSGCRNLTSITIPDSIKSLGNFAFSSCRSLSDITIPNNVTRIGESAFEYCNLVSIVIPEGVKSIGAWAFSGCSSLTSITLPDNVENIEGRTFINCSALTSIIIPDGVKNIGVSAFRNCTSLTNITIPNSLISIGILAFDNCNNLLNVIYTGSRGSWNRISIGTGNEYLTNATITYGDDIILIDGTDGNIVWALNDSGVLTISGTGSMNNYELSNNYATTAPWGNSATSIVIENGVSGIGNYAFYDCENLTNISIPESVTSIGDCAFSGCEKITDISIPDNVTHIGSSSFNSCNSLKSISLPNNISSIEKETFYGCRNLANISLPSNLTSIGENAFTMCWGLRNIIFPDNLINIGNYAFFDTGLTNITFPNNLSIIGDSAFYNCYNLTSITIPDSVINIGTSAFSNCSKLQNIVIPNCFAYIYEWARTNGNVDNLIVLNHPFEIFAEVLPTCTENGFTSGTYCTECGLINREEIPALGHDLVHHESQIPTCTTTGWDEFDACTRCDYTTFVEKAALGHDLVHHEGQAPTCTATGWDAYDTCSRCDYSTYEEIPALGHDLIHHEAKVPTSSKEGWDEYDSCKRVECSYTTQHILTSDMFFRYSPAPTCTTDGIAKYICELGDYGLHYHNLVIKALGHTEIIDAAVTATCNEAGKTEGKHCSVCNEVLVAQEIVPALGHDLVHHDAQTATCTDVGWEAYDTCSRCDYTTYIEIPALGHTIVIDPAVVPTQSNTGLTEGSHCSVCGEVLVAQELVPVDPESPIIENGTCGGNLTWMLDVQGLLSISGTGAMEDYEIVDLLDYSTTAAPWAIYFGNESFGGEVCNKITEVYIGYGITHIDCEAFNIYSGSNPIMLPDSVVSVRYVECGTWFGCSSINSEAARALSKAGIPFYVPDSARYRYIFDGDTIIGLEIVSMWNQIDSFEIPEGVTAISSYSFSSNTSLKSITIPNTVIEIGRSAFNSCVNLPNIDIPDSVKNIRSHVFSGCTSLKNIEIPNSVTNLGDGVFENCSSLTSMVIPASIYSIGEKAFYGCSGLSNLVFLHLPENDLRVYSEYDQQVSFDNLGISKSATIFCYEYTAIESWARDNGYCVILLDDLDIESIRTLSLQEDFRIPNGCTQLINYSVFPNFDNPNIIWTSSNPSVASVDNGIVSAHNVGTAVISVTVDSVTECVTVTVFSLAESFDLNVLEYWIVAKDTLQLNIINVQPDDSEINIVWSSSDTSYASVDSFGLVTTKRPNNEAVIITATDISGIYRECLLHICYPVTAIEYEENETTIIPYVDYQAIVNVTMRSQNCVNHLVDFSSSNPEIATVDENGIVHGITAGTATITATAASGVTASMTIYVREPSELVLPTSITEIENEAFMGIACEVVIIPENCTTIGEHAFAGCTELLYVRIPASITSYPASAFEGCNESLMIDWEGH